MNKQQRYAASFKELREESKNLSADAIKRTQNILQDAKKNILSELANAPEDSWKSHRAKALSQAIELQLDNFEEKYRIQLSGDLKSSWDLGRKMVDVPLVEMKVGQSLLLLPTSTLSILQGYSADLISGLSGDALKMVNRAITQGIIGQKTPWEVMKDIERDFFGNDKGVSAKAETITRTEMARVRHTATQARMEQLNEKLPGMLKVWHKGKSRTEHTMMDGMQAAVDEPFITPIMGDKIMYPVDPAAPASQTVNCMCFITMTHPEWK